MIPIDGSKYCSYEINGEPKYFICARNEYCCNFGCCVHLAFQFYQLWYYWLLLIFMFMICSGGSWWYKFCRQNDATTNYPSIASRDAIDNRYYPPTSLNLQQHIVNGNGNGGRSRGHHHYSHQQHHQQRQTIDRNLDVIGYYQQQQRLWKSNQPPPNYFTAARQCLIGSSSVNAATGQQCPYYQLYGPPPSYESIVRIANTNGSVGGRRRHNETQPTTTCVLVLPATSSAALNSDEDGADMKSSMIVAVRETQPSISVAQPQEQQPSVATATATTTTLATTSATANFSTINSRNGNATIIANSLQDDEDDPMTVPVDVVPANSSSVETLHQPQKFSDFISDGATDNQNVSLSVPKVCMASEI